MEYKNVKYICTEPWNGIGDFNNHKGELKHKKGIKKLEICGKFCSSYSIEIE